MNPASPSIGFLIAIEGIDGAGKTTQAHFVQERLQARNLCVNRTKEPTSGTWGQILRDSALTGRLSLDEEIEAFIQDRREHVEAYINPEIEAGHVVIVDRYYFSNMAYQGARGFDPLEIMRLNEAFAPEPDLLVLLDIEPRSGLQRIKTRGDRADHFETTGTLEKAREIFNGIKKPYLYRLDASLEEDVICDSIVARFSLLYTDKIAKSDLGPKDQLNATLRLFGGSPLRD